MKIWVASLSLLLLVNTQTVDRTGNCICDFTEAYCDANCCCDTDCDSRTIFLAFTKCRREKYGDKKGVKCTEPPVSLLEPFYINPTGSVEAIVNTEDEYYSRQIATRNTEAEKSTVCIVHDNLGLDDSSYNNPLTVNPLSTVESITAIESETRFRNVWNYDRETFNGDWTSPPSAGNQPNSGNVLPGVWYRVGDRVTAVKLTPTPTALPYLILPRPLNGICSDATPAYFLRNVILESNSCLRLITNLRQQCTSPLLAISRWLSLGVAPPEGPELTGANLGARSLAAVVTIFDSSGAALDPAVQTTFDEATGTCINAVQSVQISIKSEYPVNQGISFLNFNIIIRTATIQRNTNSFSQNYGVAWLDKNTDLALLPIPGYSGAPGYVKGDQIRTPTGLLSLPFGHDCATAGTRQVKFLFDISSSGCLVTLNKQQFTESCREGILNRVLPTQTAALPVSVAAFANSNPATAEDWTTVVVCVIVAFFFFFFFFLFVFLKKKKKNV